MLHKFSPPRGVERITQTRTHTGDVTPYHERGTMAMTMTTTETPRTRWTVVPGLPYGGGILIAKEGQPHDEIALVQ